MPIEDATKMWSEDKSPYIAVARLVVQPQSSWSKARYDAIDTGMSFSPWHGIAAHRPLGGIMRVRRSIYERTIAFRGSHNGCPMTEPSARRKSMDRVCAAGISAACPSLAAQSDLAQKKSVV